MMEALPFAEICAQVAAEQRERNSIGVLGEKILHAVLKRYWEPDVSRHEKKIGPYVADIVNQDGVVEIQTRNFQALPKKLDLFLSLGPVAVVYPIVQTKYLCWIDESTGEVTKKRKSPKTGSPMDAFRELYHIKTFLAHPNLQIHFPLVDVEEYRLLNGWGRGGKRGSTRYERVPTGIHEVVALRGPADYRRLLPDSLPGCFTTLDVQKNARISPACATKALNVLLHLEAVERVGKQGKRFLYQRAGLIREAAPLYPDESCVILKENIT